MKTENVRINRLLEMLKTSDDDSFLLFALAQEYTKQNDFQQARHYYTELLSKHAEYTGAYLHSGKLYEQEGDITKAISEYEKGIEVCRKLNAIHDLNELQAALNVLTL